MKIPSEKKQNNDEEEMKIPQENYFPKQNNDADDISFRSMFLKKIR